MHDDPQLLRRVLTALAPTPLLKGVGGAPFMVDRLGEGEHHLVYRLRTGDKTYCLRLPRSDSTRHHDRAVEADTMRQVARAGVGAPVRAVLPELGAILTDFIDGRMLADADAADPVVLAKIAATLRRLHDGPPLRGYYDPAELFARYDRRMRRRKARVPGDFGRLFDVAGKLLGVLQAHARPPRPCHNDPVPANFLDDGHRLWLIDWEFGGMNDPFFDLATLSIQAHLNREQDSALLAAWGGSSVDAAAARLAAHRYLVCFLWLQYNTAEFARFPYRSVYEQAAKRWLDRCRGMMTAGIETRIGELNSAG